MPKSRPPIPNKTKDELLVKCRHSCCICERFGAEIHHIDGNPSNNRKNNLIPLCGHCAGISHVVFPPASRIQGITPSQLLLYKKNWIEKCSSIRPQVFYRIDELAEKLVKLQGEIIKLQHSRDDG